ncbi:glycosyltransferase [Saccharothrix longispora]|uniref:glycosyltransferase n=1 Tax=Saccharothrix longispora TaxID=33920 RepID=UPI0028FD5882|nr:glycosyltransferase [Saccharothrix longispora]MDU0291715.1 glycosyltransferase [Saccharothrix longispora]
MRRVLGALVAGGSATAALGTAHALVNSRLVRTPPVDPPPCREPVSLLVPARDEAHRIAPTLRSLLAQRGVPDLEVLVCDDGSTDGTADVVRAVAAGDPRVRLLTGSPPPAGLPGKPAACARLAAEARGRVLVFVDADVVLAPHAAAAAADLLRSAGLDAVSPFPRQLADDPATRLVQPLLQWSWLVFLPLRLAERSPRESLSAANGQFFVVDAEALRRCGGFEAVADAVLDDIALMRAVKRSGGRGAVADGSGVAECRMYRGWSEVAAGYEKSLWAATGSPVGAVLLAAALAWVFVLPPVAALAGSRAGLLGYAAAVAGRVVTARRTGGRAWPDALAHPVSVAALLRLLARSWRARRAGTLTWKNRPLHGSR